MPQSLDLQVSVKLQFVLASTRIATSQEALALVRSVLDEPLTAQCALCSKQHTFFLPLAKIENCKSSRFSHMYDTVVDTRRWSVKEDVGIVADLEEWQEHQPSELNFYGISISSRGFGNDHLYTTVDDDDSHIHQVSMKVELQAALSKLQTKLGSLGGADWLFVAPGCTTSIVAHASFPVRVVKRIASLIVLWQRQFDALRAPDQLCSETLFPDSLGTHMDAWLRLLARSTSFGSLGLLLSGFARQEYIKLDNEHKSLTFSLGPSTFDVNAVSAQIDVITKLMRKCIVADESYFSWQISHEGEYREPSVTATDILRLLDCKASTIRHFTRSSKAARNAAETQLGDAIEAAGGCHSMGELAMYVANSAMSSTEPGAVQQAVVEKINAGGYGEFNADHKAAIVKYISEPKVRQKKEKAAEKGWWSLGATF